MWNVKKLGETIDADLDVFKVRSPICEKERATTAGFARVEWSSKLLQGTSLGNLICLPESILKHRRAHDGSDGHFISIKTSAHVHEKVCGDKEPIDHKCLEMCMKFTHR